MANPVKTTKTAYSKILMIDQLLTRQEALEKLLAKQQNDIAESIKDLQEIKKLLLSEQKKSEFRFRALYKKENESEKDFRNRFFGNLPPASNSLRTFQLGNTKLLQSFIELCKKHNLTYFAQSGTLLGAVRHRGFVPWDDDTDVAMFRDDIVKLRKILENNKDFKITLFYDYYVKSRQIRFRTTDDKNSCFLDIYIYDYGNDDSEDSWKRWHNKKDTISDLIEKYDPDLTREWQKVGLADENSILGKKIKPLFEKFYDSEFDSAANKDNYTTINWGLDNFPVKWRRLFKKEFIFPIKQLDFENIKINVPNEYDKYLVRQYGDIYKLPNDLASHYQHINLEKLDISAIEKFLEK